MCVCTNMQILNPLGVRDEYTWLHTQCRSSPCGRRQVRICKRKFFFWVLLKEGRGMKICMCVIHKIHQLLSIETIFYGGNKEWGYACVLYTIHQVLSIKRTIKKRNLDIYIQAWKTQPHKSSPLSAWLVGPEDMNMCYTYNISILIH